MNTAENDWIAVRNIKYKKILSFYTHCAYIMLKGPNCPKKILSL